MSGVANLNKTGNGTVVLNNAANAWSGATNVLAGRLLANGVETLGDNSAARTIAVSDGALLEIDSAANETLAQKISGQGMFFKGGAGDLTLTNENDYQGTTSILSGRLIAETVGAVNGGNQALLAIANGATLEVKLDGAGESGVMNKVIAGGGALVKSGSGSVLTLTSQQNFYSGGTIITGGTIRALNDQAVGLNVAGNTVDMTAADAALDLSFDAAPGTFNQKIQGLGQLIKSGGQDLTLTNANTFVGGTQWNDGNIALTNAAGLSRTNGAGVAGFVYVNTDGSLFTDANSDNLQNRFEVAAGRNLNFASPNSGLVIAGNAVQGVNGGAIELKNGASFASDQPLRLINNQTDLSGGAVFAPDALIAYGQTGTNAIAALTNNRAGLDGGGVYARSVSVTAASGGTVISGNHAGRNGGAFYLVGGSAGNPAVSQLDSHWGELTFSGNTAGGVDNAIHMDQNVQLDMAGAYAINLYDGISSNSSGVNGNRINVYLGTSRGPADLNLFGDSAYYGDTYLQQGSIVLNENPSSPGSYAHFGRKAGGNSFVEYADARVSGTGTIEADSILLGGTVNAGRFTERPRVADISTLGFVGNVTIGRDFLPDGSGLTKLKIDLQRQGFQADLMDITGNMSINGTSWVDLNGFSAGKYRIATTSTSGQIGGFTQTANNGGIITVSDFDTTIAGSHLNPWRYQIYYTVENNQTDLFINSQINNDYIVWTGANTVAPIGNTPSSYDTDSSYNNKWLNSPLYNWISPDQSTDMRYRQHDLVAFDSVSDLERVNDPARVDATRKNIEIITTATDDNDAAAASVAYVGDMLVTGGGTYRFTGRGIVSNADSSVQDLDQARGQLYIDSDSTVILANAANNFERGIVLTNGAVAFNNVDQLGTLFANDPFHDYQDASHGIIVDGLDAYGRLIANADNMTLGIVVAIKDEGSAFIVDTDGNDFGDSSITRANTLTITHASVDSHTNPDSGPRESVNGIYGLGTLIKTGAGTLILADENSYEGGSIVNGGTLAVAADNRLGKAGTSVLLDGATLRALDSFTIDRPVFLSDKGGTVEVDPDKTLTAVGVVADQTDAAGNPIPNPGDLHKTGSGVLVLANANTYGGDTHVDAGRLVAQGLAALGPNETYKNAYTVNNSGTRSQLELQIAGEETLYQNLIGNGEVIKSGAGRLNFVNDSAFAGRLTVQEGTLDVRSDYGLTESFRVLSGARLSGTGTLGAQGAGGGYIADGGVIAPEGVVANDSSINPTSKPLTVDGSLTFASGSRYEATITQYPDASYDPANPDRMRPVSDTIVVKNGLVTIESGAVLDVAIDYWDDNLFVDDFGESTSGRFTVIDAEDNSHVADRGILFELWEPALARGVELIQGWNGNLYQLWFEGDPMAPCSELNLTHNEFEVCRELGQLVVNKDPGMKLLNQILAQKEITDEMIVDIYNQMAGDIRANAVAMALKKPWRHPFNRLNSNIMAQRRRGLVEQVDDMASAVRGPRINNVWGEGYGRFSDIDSDGNSYSHDVRRAGFVIGYNHEISKQVSLGLAFNYSNAELKQATGKVTLDDYEFGIYNLTRVGDLFDLKTYLGYAYQRYDITRRAAGVTTPSTTASATRRVATRCPSAWKPAAPST